MKDTKTRTSKQNRALWKFFTNLADELNSSGLDMKMVLKPEIDIPWSKDTIHQFIWRPIQEAMTNKKSTTELTTKECTQVYETINRHLGDRFGLSVDWPSTESEHEKI